MTHKSKKYQQILSTSKDLFWKHGIKKVTIEDAGEADRLFSILMGDDVEKRRAYIREHALEVQNLDI